MKKHTYRSKNVNKINFSQIKERLANEPVVFAIDIAKEKQYGLLLPFYQKIDYIEV